MFAHLVAFTFQCAENNTCSILLFTGTKHGILYIRWSPVEVTSAYYYIFPCTVRGLWTKATEGFGSGPADSDCCMKLCLPLDEKMNRDQGERER